MLISERVAGTRNACSVTQECSPEALEWLKPDGMRDFLPRRTGFLTGLWLALMATAFAAPLYQVVEIGVLEGTPGSLNDSSYGQSVNNAGQVVGGISVNFSSRAVIFQGGVLSYLGTKADAGNKNPNCISGNGTVAGSASSVGFTFQGGSYTPLSGSALYSINNSGTFAGSQGNFAAFGSGTTFTPIMPATGQPAFGGGVARAINNTGQIVGEFNRAPPGVSKTGFYRNGGDPVLIPPPANYDLALPYDINASGAFAGEAIGTGFDDAFYCPGVGQPIQILPRKAGWSSARASALSDGGSVVGLGGGTGFLYQGGTMYSLSEIVDASGSDWTFEAAYDISPDGRYITGVGYHGAYRRGFLLIPPVQTAPVIVAIEKSGSVLTVDFKASPGVTGWKIRGSADLASFPADLNPSATITEPSAGNYRAVVTLNTPPDHYFLRVESP